MSCLLRSPRAITIPSVAASVTRQSGHCPPRKLAYLGGAMEVSEPIQCPFCGQMFELAIDTTVASQRFTTDCEVCCRPFEVFAECEPGQVLSVEAHGS
jgi:hypothetical protein